MPKPTTFEKKFYEVEQTFEQIFAKAYTHQISFEEALMNIVEETEEILEVLDGPC